MALSSHSGLNVLPIFDFLNPLANMTPRFTDQQLEEINEWFDENAKPLLVIYEGPPVAAITIDQIQHFLELQKFHRRNYHYPSYGDLMNEIENLKMAIYRMLIKDQFVYLLNKWVLEPDVEHELKLAFKVFDAEKRNFLEIEEIQELVTNYGDFFSEAECSEFIRDVNVRGDGNIFYEDFVENMFSLQPDLYQMEKQYLYEDPDEDPSVLPLPEPEEPPPPAPSKSKSRSRTKREKGKI